MKTLIIYIVIVYTEYGVTKPTNIDSSSIENIHLRSKMNSYTKSFSLLT
jgi:hypothetical protein